jgi:hypothetical protein
MTCGQNMEMKIRIGRLYSGSCDPKLATQSERGNVVIYGNSGPMYPRTKLLVNGMGRNIVITPMYILWWNYMKLGGCVDDTNGHLSLLC